MAKKKFEEIAAEFMSEYNEYAVDNDLIMIDDSSKLAAVLQDNFNIGLLEEIASDAYGRGIVMGQITALMTVHQMPMIAIIEDDGDENPGGGYAN